jgi:phytoene synthase
LDEPATARTVPPLVPPLQPLAGPPAASVLDATAAGAASQASAENFPVAPWLLGPSLRRHLSALYVFARFVDDLGDTAPGDRRALLAAVADDVDRLCAGRRPTLGPVAQLGPSVRRFGIPARPLHDLVQAGIRDQEVTRHETQQELLDYCRLSANPVGRLVLHVFEAATPERLRLADSICTGLQLVEHCQDVAEDLARGRVYLPAEDLRDCGVTPADLAAPSADARVREVVARQVQRAREHLHAGAPLVDTLRGRPRALTAAFLAGGLAAADAVEAAGYDVLAATPRPIRRRLLQHLLWPPSTSGVPVQRASPPAPEDDVETAYALCEEITRREARNFSYGIRLLPPPQRRAMSAVYALARRIDDIGDDRTTPREEKLRQLAAVRAQLRSPGSDGDPVGTAVADAARRYPLPLEAFGDLVSGVEMDVVGRSYETFDELVDYCRHVAGSIGQLSLGVFGTRDPAAATPLADALGVALQLTNILRDVREDLADGRVYLPAEDLAAAGVELVPGDTAGLGPAAGPLADLLRAEAARASEWYDEGLRLLPLLSGRSAACCAAMAGIYQRLLVRITARPEEALRRRLSLPAREKALVSARALAAVHR